MSGGNEIVLKLRVTGTGDSSAAIKAVGDALEQQGLKVKQIEPAAKKAADGVKDYTTAIQQQIVVLKTGEKNTAAYYEALSEINKGPKKSMEDWLQSLRQTEKEATARLNNMGVSAKQTAAAMRNVPAQFTDIVTQLQGGANPMTILMQQGGQLKDMFGGVGEASKALGSYVIGLVNPFTVAAAAGAVLGLAYYQGSKEADAFRAALLQTGNAAGTTTGQLSAMAREMSAQWGVTKGKAAEALTALAATGEVSRDNLGKFAQSAIDIQKAFDQPLATTAQQFADLGREPVKASLKLSESMHYLTTATLEQLMAAERLGDKERAADIAQQAYADAQNKRSAEVKKNLGYLEAAWGSLGSAAKKTWDFMLNVGREEDLDQQIERLEKNIASFSPMLTRGAQKELEVLKAQKQARDDAAAAEGKRHAVEKAGTEARKYLVDLNTQYQSSQEKVNEALDKYRRSMADLKAANPTDALLDPAKIKAVEAQIIGVPQKVADAAQFSADLTGKSIANQIAQVKLLADTQVIGESQAIEQTGRLRIKDMQARQQALDTQAKAFAADIDKSTQLRRQSLLITQDIANAEQQITRDKQALEAKANLAQREIDRQAIQTSYDKVQALTDETHAIDLQTRQLTASSTITDSVATLIAQENAARLGNALAATEEAFALAALNGESDKNLGVMSKVIAKLQERKTAADAVYSASATKDATQADLDQAKRSQQQQEIYRKEVQDIYDKVRALGEETHAIQLQTEQARQTGIVIENIATLVAKEELARLDRAVAVTEENRALAEQAGLTEAQRKAFDEAISRLRQLRDAQKELVGASGVKDVTQAGLDQTKRLYGADDPFKNLSSSLKDTFAGSNDGLAKMVDGMSQLVQSGKDYAREMSVIKELRDSGDASNLATAAKNEAALIKQTAAAQVSSYATMAGAAKTFFDKNTSGYKTMEAAERALRVYQLAMSASVMAKDLAAVASRVSAWLAGDSAIASSAVASAGAQVGSAMAVGQANAVAGVANQANGDPYSAFPRMAAMAAIMVGLGYAVSASGSSSGDAPESNTGTGTVFGDSSAQSKSLGNALSLLNNTQDQALIYSRQMAQSLKTIEAGLGGVTNQYLRAGGTTIEGGIQTGTTGNWVTDVITRSLPIIGSMPFVSDIINKLFGSSTSITGSGINFGAQRLGDAANNVSANQYANVQTTQKFLWWESTSSRRENSALSDSVKNQFSGVFKGIRDAVVTASSGLGSDLTRVSAAVNDFVVSIGDIDLKGLNGQQINERLSAVFGATADRVAQAAQPGLETLQKVGEGYFETLVRTSNEVEVVKVTMARLNVNFTKTGSAAAIFADNLVNTFGGLDKYSSAMSSYYNSFFSSQERAAQTAKELGSVFKSMGLALPSTINGFRDLVNAQDLSTLSGRQTYATLLSLSDVFLQTQTGAKNTDVILSERADLEKQLLQFQGDTAALRAHERNALDESNRALYDRIQALQDEQRISQQRTDLETELLRLQGDTAALRAKELKALDPVNRALKKQIFALQDSQAAATDAANAAKQLRQSWESLGNTMQSEVDRIRGLISDPSGGNFASLQTQFTLATAQARAGDQTAASRLTGLSQSLLNAASSSATSGVDLARIQAATASSLEQTMRALGTLGVKVPSFDVGTNLVPHDMLALVHKNEAIVPEAYNPFFDGNNAPSTGPDLSRLSEDIGALRADNSAENRAMVALLQKVSRVLDDVSQGGTALRTITL